MTVCFHRNTQMETLGNFLREVRDKIFKQPDTPDLSVLSKCNISFEQHDRLVDLVNQNQIRYAREGLFDMFGLKKGDINKIGCIVKAMNPNETLLVSLQCFSPEALRPHATFFVYQFSTLKIKGQKKPTILLCDINPREVEQLKNLLDQAKKEKVTKFMHITVERKPKGNAKQLISIDDVFTNYLI